VVNKAQQAASRSRPRRQRQPSAVQIALGLVLLAGQQKEIVAKLDLIAPHTKGFGWASAGLLLLIAGFSMYQAFTHFQSGQ
jgi:hypothetical protein